MEIPRGDPRLFECERNFCKIYPDLQCEIINGEFTVKYGHHDSHSFEITPRWAFIFMRRFPQRTLIRFKK